MIYNIYNIVIKYIMSKTLKRINNKKGSRKRSNTSKKKGGSFKPNQFDLGEIMERRTSEPLLPVIQNDDESIEEAKVDNESLENQIDLKNELESLKRDIELLKSQLALMKEENVQKQTIETVSPSHILVGFGDCGWNTDREPQYQGNPVFVPRNIVDRLPWRYINNCFNATDRRNSCIILPNLYSIESARNLNFIEISKYKFSFVDENGLNVLPHVFDWNSSKDEINKYINKYISEINDVMEKYPGLFLPI